MSQKKNWLICPDYDFCYGPEVEAVSTGFGSFTYRWEVHVDGSGNVTYGRDDLAMSPMSFLFPSPVTGIEQISISFDGNARPVIAFSKDGVVEVRKTQAGLPTSATFSGSWPRLWYNGILQPLSSLQDVMCFYIRNGAIYFRLERDEFGIEYPVSGFDLTGITPYRITKTDHALRSMDLYFKDGSGRFLFFKSTSFPFFVSDSSSHDISVVSGSYSDATITLESYSDQALFADHELLSSEYRSASISSSASDSASYSQLEILGSSYILIVISGGTYTDSASYSNIELLSSSYDFVVTSGGTYSDSASYSQLELLSSSYA